MTDYRVIVTHRCMRLSDTSCTDWAHCLAVGRIMGRAHPEADVSVVDADNYDYDPDLGAYPGVTMDEVEQFGDAVYEGKLEARRSAIRGCK